MAKIKKQKNKICQRPIIDINIVLFTIEDGQLKVFLEREESNISKKWILPGNCIREGESLEKIAYQKLSKKTDVKDVYLEQLYTFDSNKKDSRGQVITISYFVLIHNYKIKIDPKNENVGLFSIKKLPSLSYNHKEIIGYALERLKYKLEYTNAAYSLLPQYFTFGALQKVYEIILGKKLDKRNFRKKIVSLNLIKKTNKKQIGEAHRPATLYTFKEHKGISLKKREIVFP